MVLISQAAVAADTPSTTDQQATQQTVQTPDQATTQPPTDQPLMGGYNKANPKDPEVINVAQFAAQQMNAGTLHRVLEAEKQVVAGLNYKLLLAIKTSKGKLKNYSVVVFVPLPATKEAMQLTESKPVP